MAEEVNIDAYFERIGFAGSIAPSLETLSLLVQQHAVAIPFENLDPLMGAPVRLDLSNLQQKLLFDHRGGYFLEHGLLFKAVLESLDFEVSAHGATVLWGHEDRADRPINHLVLLVSIAGGSYLTDVGFGGLTPTAPLRLRNEAEQATPHETFRLTDSDGTWQVEAKLGEDWKPLYTFQRTAFGADGIAALSEATSTRGMQRDTLMVARAEKSRRLTLKNLTFKTHGPAGATESRKLGSVAELREVLSGPFGIALPNDERLDPALEKIVAGSA